MLPGVGEACRCAQLTLAEYFDAADTVLFARAMSSTELSDRRTIDFDLLVPAYKGEDVALTGGTMTFSTALSSASCGITPDISAIYVVFARKSAESAGQWIDYCSGTRVHLAENIDEPQGFADVPARFVVSQLNGLAGMEVLREVAANAPDATDGENGKLIGLLQIADGQAVDVFVDASDDTSPIGHVSDAAALETLEYSYEEAGAIVYARLSGFYRVRLASGRFGWIRAADAGEFYPYEALLLNRLSYLNQHWSGFVWPEAGAGLPQRSSQATSNAVEVPVNVIESKIIGGMPWFRVEIYDGEICTGLEPSVSMSGWIPGYGRSGEPSLWFYSRGC